MTLRVDIALLDVEKEALTQIPTRPDLRISVPNSTRFRTFHEIQYRFFFQLQTTANALCTFQNRHILDFQGLGRLRVGLVAKLEWVGWVQWVGSVRLVCSLHN